MSKIGRKRAIETISSYPRDPFAGEIDIENVEEIYASNVFSQREMKKRLPKETFKSIMSTIEGEQPLDAEVADTVASAMKDWAISKGATHYAHVFFPLTGLTAEKHDSFYEPTSDGHTLAEFAGSALVQGEPDASSFPHGGLRETFEARGYTAWDVSSPAYIFENPNGATLCIPTAFISWTGEALDKKTPLLRSMQALNKQSQRLLTHFGHEEIARVSSSAGPEQEYFLLDKNFFYQRPDLLNAGRTLFGAAPPKGQEFDDHYFGAIADRVAACMFEVERELFKLGIPAKTRHNEVAPGQYEIAPVYESANIATDHQQLVMVTLKRVAEKHGMVCLTHEKPFAGVNGSGKHVNFSVGNSTQGNLLDPGDTAEENAQFLAFCAAVIRAVHKNSTLLRAVIASAGNDHRLGANEAPPAILSVFLGQEFTEVFEAIARGESGSSKAKDVLKLGVDLLPDLPKDSGDRNRTSPFAFIGNRFEFRAVGSDSSIAGPMVAINTILAESIDWICEQIEDAAPSTTEEFNQTLQKIIGSIWNEHKAVVFNGDGYSEEWHRQAVEDRGLPNLESTADALPVLVDDQYVEMFEKYNVLNKRELESRLSIYIEQYTMQLNVEANLTVEIARTQILPAAMKYLGQLASTAEEVQDLGLEPELSIVSEVNDGIKTLKSAIDALIEKKAGAPEDDEIEEALYMKDEVFPAMNAVREAADALEELVDDELWPLPTYQEMLFIK